MAKQEPVPDARDLVSAKHKITGVAITWDAEQVFYLPASRGTVRQKSGPFTCRIGKAVEPSNASL